MPKSDEQILGTGSSNIDDLHDILNRIGLSDDDITGGIMLTDGGFQKIAKKFGTDVKGAKFLLNQVKTRISQRAGRLDEDEDDAAETDRFTYESDFLGNVTLRDTAEGKEVFLRGGEASSVLKSLDGADKADKQKILSRYASLMEALSHDDQEEAHAKAQEVSGYWGAQAAGCIFLAKDTGRILLAFRSEWVDQPNCWGTWGGAIDEGENPIEAVRRECQEEAGFRGKIDKIVPLYVFKAPHFRYSNFMVVIDKEFKPRLNSENSTYRWVDYEFWPRPFHPGLKKLLSDGASRKAIEAELKKVKVPVTESAKSDEEETFDAEIESKSGTYNFPWKIGGDHGFATARFTGVGPKMKISLVQITDADGNEAEDISNEDKATIHKEAISFIGKV